MTVEEDLWELAATDPRITVLRVETSTSKAQNVNAAIAAATGVFTGIFDADHHPDPDSFRRAWAWLANGYDVVQGHPVVRNGESGWVARTIAAEFEAIYSVAHPGRAAVHGFGLFGGSTGFWRTEVLARIRMRPAMLTEDIDSSLRTVTEGHRIAVDPAIVSYELAPVTVSALWNQRMRWAQGWLQVSLRHCLRGMRSPHLSLRQKAGLFHLLAWREFYPWLSWQMFPVMAYWSLKAGGPQNLEWAVPIFVATTVFTLSVGPGQTLIAWRLAHPSVRRRWWFAAYLLTSFFVYTEFKNLISRVSHLRELLGYRQWKVTPRTADPVPAAEEQQDAA
jgi:cellulose synthase/poly-beta-1,6-N-acetylglucosamine synthase-like glycosyltransferase